MLTNVGSGTVWYPARPHDFSTNTITTALSKSHSHQHQFRVSRQRASGVH